MDTNLKEIITEKSLVKRGETSLRKHNAYTVKPILQTTVGVLFYVASFVVAAVIGYVAIFSVFNLD